MTPITVFSPRLTQPLGVEVLGGWSLKWYAINVDPAPIEERVLHAAMRHVATTVPEADVDPALGFVIVHRGLEAVWLLTALWRLDILYQRTYRAPLTEPADYEEVGPGGPTACVWELVVHAHERDALVAHLLSGAASGATGYLRDAVRVDAGGDA
jgi:hypothetical protein